MQFSIRKLTLILVSMVIVVTLATSGAGIYVLQQHYRTAETRFDAEARDSLHVAVLAIRNQVRFYQGIVSLIAAKPEISDMIVFAEAQSLTKWSQTIARMLPGTLGTALASENGAIFGDRRQQRIGEACQADLQHFSEGARISYPPIHTDRPGLEHFDLFAEVRDAEGTITGRLFISFRLEVLGEALEDVMQKGQVFELLDKSGKIAVQRGLVDVAEEVRTYREPVPGTDWELVLRQPHPDNLGFYSQVIIADLGILLIVGIFIAVLTRNLLNRFNQDLVGIHQALLDVYNGKFKRFAGWSGIKETEILMPDLENIARRLQEQQNELREQSLSDPMTGLYNRRYFDILLAHEHEQSRRTSGSLLAIMDLNKFKQVNDTLGHLQGDKVLVEVSRFLNESCRSTDTLARLGGDEFALILIDMAPEDLAPWARSFLDRFDNFIRHNELTRDLAQHCTMSMGVASIDVSIYAAPGEVFNAADDAMYRAKLMDLDRSRMVVATASSTGMRDAVAGPR